MIPSEEISTSTPPLGGPKADSSVFAEGSFYGPPSVDFPSESNALGFLQEPNSSPAETHGQSMNGSSHLLTPNKEILNVVPSERLILRSSTFFRALAKWEGEVVSVGQDSFNAHLVPISGDAEEMSAEIYLEEITDDDLPLVEPGSVFYWSIGYLNQPKGRVSQSIIRFRRLPNWTQEELDQAIEEANRLQQLFDGK